MRTSNDARAQDPKVRSPAAEWMTLVRGVSSYARQLRRTLAALASARGLSESELLLLWSCGQAPPHGLNQAKLSAEIGVSAAQTSSLVLRLRQRYLLEERRAEIDRRERRWRLTASGQELLTLAMDDLTATCAGPQMRNWLGGDGRETFAAAQRLHALMKRNDRPCAENDEGSTL